ncbi:MAG: TetR/AcrR family transcriptional regulator [Bacillota bacterium]
MKEKITKAAMDQILKNGFKGFIVDDICKAIGMSKKTVYKYFNSKNEIIASVIDYHIENDRIKTHEAIENAGDMISKLKSVMVNYYDYVIPINLINELQSFFPKEWKKVKDMMAYKQKLFKSVLQEGISKGEIKSSIDIDVLMLIFEKTVPALMEASFLEKHDKTYRTANKMLDEFEKIIFYGISYTN